MDPLMRKLFQPREAREKLRGMGGIMSSSPQLASTVAKFNVGGPIQAMAPERVDLGGAMPLASAIHGPSNMMYGQMSLQQLSILANSGDRLAAEILMMLQPPADVPPSQRSGGFSLSNVGPNLETLTAPFIGVDRDAEIAQIEAQLQDPSLSEFQREALETRLMGLRPIPGTEGVVDAVIDFGGRVLRTPGDLLGKGLSLFGATDAGAAVSKFFDPEFYDANSRRYRDALGTASAETPAAPVADAKPPVAETTAETPAAPVAETTAETPAAPVAETTAETPAAPVAETTAETPPAPTIDVDVDLNDPSTFDTNFKTVMSRLEGVMGTGSKSSREDAMANLAMIGLAIAAGQSPDALTNIAQGALTGMQAIRAEKKDREEQEKALRMLGITAALDMTAAGDAEAATAARDEVGFQRDLQKLQEESRLIAERSAEELRLRAELGLGTGEGSVFNRSETPQEVYMKTLQTVRDAAPGTIGEVPEGMSQSVYAQRLAAQDALRHIEGLITMRILTDPDQIAAQQQLYRSRIDSTLTDAEIEQALTDGS